MKSFTNLFLDAANYYHENLTKSMTGTNENEIYNTLLKKGYTDSQIVLSGLCSRRKISESKYVFFDKISHKTLKSLNIGFADSEEQGLYNYLFQKGYSEKQILDSNLCKLNKEDYIEDVFKNRAILPAISTDGEIIGLISKLIGHGFNEKDAFINIQNPDIDTSDNFLFTYNYDGEKRGYVILCENPFDVIYYYDTYVFNSIGFFDKKIELTENVLDFIRNSGATVQFKMNADQAGSYRADVLKDELKKNNIFVL